MTNLNDKEKAAENKFAHDQELQFKVHAKRDKLLGAWVADKLGLAADKKEEYVKSVVAADLYKKDDADVIAKVKTDLETVGIRLTDHEIAEQLHRCLQEAKKQLMNE